MEDRSSGVPQIQLSILDALLDAEPSLIPSAPSPVYLTAGQVAQLLDSFQDLVLATVAYRNGSRSVHGISRPQRAQFALVVSGYQASSFHIYLKPRPNLSIGQRLEVVALTAQVAQLGLEFVQLVQLGQGQTLDPRQAIVLVAMTTFVGIVQSIGRIAVVQAGDATFTADKESIQAIRHLNDEYNARSMSADEQAATIQTVQRPVTFTGGTVVTAEPLKREMQVHFLEFSEPVRCRYNPLDRSVLGELREGDQISIRGQALYLRDTPLDAVPLIVDIEDYSDLPHRRESMYKF